MTTQELMDQSIEAFDAGNFEQALQAANEVIAAAPEAEQLAAAWFMKGVSNESLGNLPEAISAYTEATKLEPTRAAAWYRLSKVLLWLWVDLAKSCRPSGMQWLTPRSQGMPRPSLS